MTAHQSAAPRVLHVITHLAMGGAENVALGLIDSLRDDIDFALFAVIDHAEPGPVGQAMAARLTDWGVPFAFGTRRGFKSGGVVQAAWRLARMVRRFRPDVIHVHTEIPELTLAIAHVLSPAVRATPILRTVHNSVLWIDWAGIGRWVTRRLAGAQAVAVSRAAADADAAILPGRPRAEVVHNGIVAQAAPAPTPRDPSPLRILFAGRLVHQKGADLLPAILGEAHARTPRRDVAVTIAGSGDLADMVARGVAGIAPGWTIALTGPIANLAARLTDHDIVLLPSRFEGFPLLPAEVLIAGVPLVTTIAPGLDELLPADYPFHAASGDVATLGRLLARVIDDLPAARAVAAGQGRVIATRFDPVVMAAAYRDRYRLPLAPPPAA
ncbi:hypothetical protein ASG37_15420 [Sphingomonas sp. Leaf407]|uniref:glycosyltransferase n=1 Tax=unclassified Sphingomonas TaxID=196159 RepID=UPI0006F8A8A6|nr:MULTISPECIES: glycosyltransferase [unclassified Sphingomonas]KQN35706.1 hypothetical protein ASE97_14675 [Sphingomonas sp. Leaf42]KQT26573.1 hypothetical protein ASG37_15420 [Sphingomonas sp. Leaf407]